MTTKLWERIRAIPGEWIDAGGVICHEEFEDQLGNKASILQALFIHETGYAYCNCCLVGMLKGAHAGFASSEDMGAILELEWLAPPTRDEWPTDEYEGVPKELTPHQAFLLRERSN